MNFALRKIFILVVVAVFAVSVGLFLKAQFFRNDAGVSAQTTCAIISYAQDKAVLGADSEQLTKPVLVDGVANSGQLDFNKADSNLKACIYKSNDKFLMEGLVWNTNLGWMSFNGTGYGVSVSVDGKAEGKAYGDNIGYIQMGCENGANLGENCTASTGATNYGVRVAMTDGEISSSISGDCGTMKKGDLYGLAWADTVGWINFCGAHADLSVLETPQTEPTPDTGSTTPPSDTGTTTTDTETAAEEEPGQAAMVQGNFSMNIVKTEGLPVAILDENGEEIDKKIGTSLGEQAQSHREKLYRIIQKRHTSWTSISQKKFTNFDPSAVPEMEKVKNNGSNVESYIVYYHRNKDSNNKTCSIILNNAGDKSTDKLMVNKNITIVAKGCDIFIDSNVRTADKNSGLGIIALEDLTMTSERKGGNIYICSRVTDIEANLVTDGSVFSYGQEEDKCGGDDKSALVDQTTGYPNFGILSESDIKNLFRHQLAIVGSLISNNTYGGSVSSDSKYILGDGSTTINQNEARLFDLNFLRYSHTQKTGDKPTDICWDNGKNMRLSRYILQELCDSQKIKEKYCDLADDKLANQKVWNEICTENNPNKRSIVNIRYNAPTPYMPIFNGQ